MSNSDLLTKLPDNELIFYQSADGLIHLEVLFAQENVWLTQKKIAELFGTTPQNITQHLKNLYSDQEIDVQSTCKDFLQVQNEGKRSINRSVKMYSLEAIIAIGYRVNSERGTQFRQWATQILKNYIYKGYSLDKNRFKYGSRFSTRYFDELYEEIKDIRTSERMIYQKITDIYATSIDYSPKAIESQKFFATIQNKLHFAITGKTAAEIISERANSKNKNMGLTSWKRSPEGKIMPSDVITAKNYLDERELSSLNRIGNMYLDYAELQAAKGVAMTMKDWITKLDAFLKFSEYEILTNPGKISQEVAKTLALNEYQKFKIKQDQNYLSDFDKFVLNVSNSRQLKDKS